MDGQETQHEPISWQAPEYEVRERSRDWFVALWILAIAGGAAAFILRNFTFGVFLVLAAGVVTILAKRPPKILQVTIGDDGIRFGSTRYLFDRMIGFAIENFGGGHGRILIQMKHSLMPVIIIPIVEIEPAEVEMVLKKHIPQKNIEESLLEKVIHHLGI